MSLEPNIQIVVILSTICINTSATATATTSTSGTTNGRSVAGGTNDKYARRKKHKQIQDYYFRLVSLCIVILTVLSIGCTALFFGCRQFWENKKEMDGYLTLCRYFFYYAILRAKFLYLHYLVVKVYGKQIMVHLYVNLVDYLYF